MSREKRRNLSMDPENPHFRRQAQSWSQRQRPYVLLLHWPLLKVHEEFCLLWAFESAELGRTVCGKDVESELFDLDWTRIPLRKRAESEAEQYCRACLHSNLGRFLQGHELRDHELASLPLAYRQFYGVTEHSGRATSGEFAQTPRALFVDLSVKKARD